jgi:hypothetical protein
VQSSAQGDPARRSGCAYLALTPAEPTNPPELRFAGGRRGSVCHGNVLPLSCPRAPGATRRSLPPASGRHRGQSRLAAGRDRAGRVDDDLQRAPVGPDGASHGYVPSVVDRLRAARELAPDVAPDQDGHTGAIGVCRTHVEVGGLAFRELAVCAGDDRSSDRRSRSLRAARVDPIRGVLARRCALSVITAAGEHRNSGGDCHCEHGHCEGDRLYARDFFLSLIALGNGVSNFIL